MTAIINLFKEFGKAPRHWFAKESKQGEFNWATTATQALDGKDLTGKVAVVTGSNTGCGKETARVLAEGNATVVMACRSLERGEAARQDIISSLNTSKDDAENRVKLIQLDLGDLNSVKQFTDDFNELDLPCHYLVENAGIMMLPHFQETAQGLEKQWGVNHIGHFQLGKLMLPRLQQDPPSRLIVLSSIAQKRAPDMNEWTNEHGGEKPHGPTQEKYSGTEAYSVAKMSNLMFAQEFNRRYFDSGVTAVSVHPGAVPTELGRHLPPLALKAYKLLLGPFQKTIPQGAATTVRCVSMNDDEIVPGAYYEDCQVVAFREDVQFKPGVPVQDTPQFKLWELSEEIISGLGF